MWDVSTLQMGRVGWGGGVTAMGRGGGEGVSYQSTSLIPKGKVWTVYQ